MNENKGNLKFRLLIVFLMIVLAVVIFYIFYVHIPYYNHESDLLEIRNTIINENHYQYDDDFVQYDTDQTYYLIRIKDKGVSTYVAFDEKKKYVDRISGPFADAQRIIKAINKEYKVELEELTVGYENKTFVYYGHYQDDDHLYYFYYSLKNGNFIKSYQL